VALLWQAVMSRQVEPLELLFPQGDLEAIRTQFIRKPPELN
jgi:hypothetical protein